MLAENIQLTDEKIFEIAVASPEDIERWAIQERFNAIAQLKRRILMLHKTIAAEGQHYVNEESPLLEVELEAINLLAKSLRHSQAYLSLLDNSRKGTLELIKQDNFLIRQLKKWSLGLDTWKREWSENILRRIHRHQVTATRHALQTQTTITKTPINKTPIHFFEQPYRHGRKKGRSFQRVKGGSFHGKLGFAETRKIKINLHSDTNWKTDPIKIASIVHHETIHDQGFQLANAFHLAGKLTAMEPLTSDAQLWVGLKTELASISSRIYSAYRAQFHEVVAFEQQRQFREELEALLCEGP